MKMTTPSLIVLESRDELRDFLYHLKEIMRTLDRIASLAAEVDQNLERDKKQAARSLTFLEAEVFDHLGYHLAEIRGPFNEFLDRMYPET